MLLQVQRTTTLAAGCCCERLSQPLLRGKSARRLLSRHPAREKPSASASCSQVRGAAQAAWEGGQTFRATGGLVSSSGKNGAAPTRGRIRRFSAFSGRRRTPLSVRRHAPSHADFLCSLWFSAFFLDGPSSTACDLPRRTPAGGGAGVDDGPPQNPRGPEAVRDAVARAADSLLEWHGCRDAAGNSPESPRLLAAAPRDGCCRRCRCSCGTAFPPALLQPGFRHFTTGATWPSEGIFAWNATCDVQWCRRCVVVTLCAPFEGRKT